MRVCTFYNVNYTHNHITTYIYEYIHGKCALHNIHKYMHIYMHTHISTQT